MDLIRELWAFLRTRKKLWFFPLIIAMLLLAAVMVLAQGSAVAPFIYSLF